MKAIVLTYKRAQLTLDLVSRLYCLDREFRTKYGHEFFSDIYIFHDGVRDTEDPKSRIHHEKTRDLCLSLQSNNPKTSVYTFNSNIGLTRNLFRILEALGNKTSECILFEEDKAPSMKALEFLQKNRNSMESNFLLDTLPLSKHTYQNSLYTETMFTDNGNIVMGESLFALIKELWIVKDKYQSEFERNLNQYLGSVVSGFALTRATRYYAKFWTWGLFNCDRPDSLISYALILSKNLKTCPIAPVSENWSDRDKLGKNVRAVPTNRGLECIGDKERVWNHEICLLCETKGISERVELNLTKAVWESFKFRTSRIGVSAWENRY